MKKIILAAAVTAATQAGIAAEWIAKTNKDPMNDRVSQSALLVSSNSVPLGLRDNPYKGLLYFWLDDQELTAAFGAMDSVMDCSPTEGCLIEIRTDDTPVKPFFAMGRSTNHEYVRFRRPYELAEHIRGAKKILVRAPFYRSGREIFEFTQTNDMPLAEKPTPAQ